jgi:vacuolar protein sorting-associated protein 16
MLITNPRVGWEKVGDQFYRKFQLYESVFDPDLELENYVVAGAPYGGAVGMFENSVIDTLR